MERNSRMRKRLPSFEWMCISAMLLLTLKGTVAMNSTTSVMPTVTEFGTQQGDAFRYSIKSNPFWPQAGQLEVCKNDTPKECFSPCVLSQSTYQHLNKNQDQICKDLFPKKNLTFDVFINVPYSHLNNISYVKWKDDCLNDSMDECKMNDCQTTFHICCAKQLKRYLSPAPDHSMELIECPMTRQTAIGKQVDCAPLVSNVLLKAIQNIQTRVLSWTLTTVNYTEIGRYQDSCATKPLETASSLKSCMNKTYAGEPSVMFGLTKDNSCVKINSSDPQCYSHCDTNDCSITVYSVTTMPEVIQVPTASEMCVYFWKENDTIEVEFHLTECSAELPTVLSNSFCLPEQPTTSRTAYPTKNAGFPPQANDQADDKAQSHLALIIGVGVISALCVITIVTIVVACSHSRKMKRRELRRESGTHNSVANRTYTGNNGRPISPDEEMLPLAEEIYSYIDDVSTSETENYAPPLPSRNPVMADYTTPADAVERRSNSDDVTEYTRTFDDREHSEAQIHLLDKLHVSVHSEKIERGNKLRRNSEFQRNCTESSGKEMPARHARSLPGYDSSNVDGSLKIVPHPPEARTSIRNFGKSSSLKNTQSGYKCNSKDIGSLVMTSKSHVSGSDVDSGALTLSSEKNVNDSPRVHALVLPTKSNTTDSSSDSDSDSSGYQEAVIIRKGSEDHSMSGSSGSLHSGNAEHIVLLPGSKVKCYLGHTGPRENGDATITRKDSYEDTNIIDGNIVKHEDSYEDTSVVDGKMERSRFWCKSKPKNTNSEKVLPFCLHNIPDSECDKLGIRIVPAEGSENYEAKPSISRTLSDRVKNNRQEPVLNGLNHGSSSTQNGSFIAKDPKHCMKNTEYDRIGNIGRDLNAHSDRIYDHIASVKRKIPTEDYPPAEKFPFVPFIEGNCVRRYSI